MITTQMVELQRVSPNFFKLEHGFWWNKKEDFFADFFFVLKPNGFIFILTDWKWGKRLDRSDGMMHVKASTWYFIITV